MHTARRFVRQLLSLFFDLGAMATALGARVAADSTGARAAGSMRYGPTRAKDIPAAALGVRRVRR